MNLVWAEKSVIKMINGLQKMGLSDNLSKSQMCFVLTSLGTQQKQEHPHLEPLMANMDLFSSAPILPPSRRGDGAMGHPFILCNLLGFKTG